MTQWFYKMNLICCHYHQILQFKLKYVDLISYKITEELDTVPGRLNPHTVVCDKYIVQDVFGITLVENIMNSK